MKTFFTGLVARLLLPFWLTLFFGCIFWTINLVFPFIVPIMNSVLDVQVSAFQVGAIVGCFRGLLIRFDLKD